MPVRVFVQSIFSNCSKFQIAQKRGQSICFSLFRFHLADHRNDERANDKHTCGNLRRQSELTLHRLRLVLSKERLGAARNRTQAIGFARLKQNGSDEELDEEQDEATYNEEIADDEDEALTEDDEQTEDELTEDELDEDTDIEETDGELDEADEDEDIDQDEDEELDEEESEDEELSEDEEETEGMTMGGM